MEGEFRKYVTTKGGSESTYALKDSFFIGRWGNTPCVIRRYLIAADDDDAKFKQRELEALKIRGNIHENFIRYLGEFTPSNSKDFR